MQWADWISNASPFRLAVLAVLAIGGIVVLVALMLSVIERHRLRGAEKRLDRAERRIFAIRSELDGLMADRLRAREPRGANEMIAAE